MFLNQLQQIINEKSTLRKRNYTNFVTRVLVNNKKVKQLIRLMVVAYQLFRNTWYTAACGRSRQTAQHRIPPSLCSSFSDSSPSVMVLRFLADGPSSAWTYSGKGLLLEDAKESAAGASAILLCVNKNTNKKITNKTKQKTYKLSKYTCQTAIILHLHCVTVITGLGA